MASVKENMRGAIEAQPDDASYDEILLRELASQHICNEVSKIRTTAETCRTSKWLIEFVQVRNNGDLLESPRLSGLEPLEDV